MSSSCFYDSLLGSLAITKSEGELGSPAPEKLMAMTRNSYSIPSTTSVTAYCLAVGKAKLDFHCIVVHF